MSKENPLTLPTMNGTTAELVEAVNPSHFVNEIAAGDLSGWAVEENTGNTYDLLGAQRPALLEQQPSPTTKPRPKKKPPHKAWFVAQGEAGSIRMIGPFDNQTVALDTQEALGGKSRLYEAESKNTAEAAHLGFLTRVAGGHDSW